MSLKSLFSAKDMTLGSPWKRIMEFSVPMLLGNIAQQLYNTADSVIVGIYVGDNALAAVGSAAPILNLLLALFVGIATGAGIVVSQCFGAKDRDGLSRGIGNCLYRGTDRAEDPHSFGRTVHKACSCKASGNRAGRAYA